MNNDERRAEPGWYPTPEGGKQYWDGNQWLSLPPPTPDNAPTRGGSRRKWIWGALVALVLVGLSVGIISFIVADRNREQEAAAAAAAAIQAEEEASARAAEEAAETEEAEEASRQAQEREDERKREYRQNAVVEIEESIGTMAEGHLSDGLIDGQVLEVNCSPVAGGSLDDLTEQTTVFSCFVSTEDNGDGTHSGYHYHATMNWNTEQFSYGFGAP